MIRCFRGVAVAEMLNGMMMPRRMPAMTMFLLLVQPAGADASA